MIQLKTLITEKCQETFFTNFAKLFFLAILTLCIYMLKI